ncbi:MAG: DUF3106 domain-containing protein, partial [Planctomycetota bacterium]|nr:DUF3106 domain-containing protein [Planctomycetota bacterium]
MRSRILTTLLLTVLLAPSVYTQEKAPRPDGRPAAKPTRAPRANPNSDRWKKLDPSKQREIEKIYQQLRSLPADKQKLLLDKLRRMKPEDRRSAVRDARTRLAMPPHEQEMRKKHLEILRRTWKELPPAEQERMKKMSPEAREKHLHARFVGQRKRTGDTLPTELRTRVRELPPAQQADFLRKHKAKVTAEKIFDADEITKLRSIDHKALRRM